MSSTCILFYWTDLKSFRDAQVLWFIGLLEIPFLLRLRDGSVDGTGDLGFDPLGLKQDSEAFALNQVKEIKNGRLAMIAIGGITHHYFLTGKGPIEFITQVCAKASCFLERNLDEYANHFLV
jgi:hypothetical protein